MKKSVFLSAVFFLIYVVVGMGGQAFAAEGEMPLYAQNIYDDQGRENEQGAYPGYEGQYNQEQPELPPLPEGEGQYNEEQPEPLEPPPYQEGDRDYNQEPPEQLEPPPYQEGDRDYNQEPPEQLEQPPYQEGENQYNEEPLPQLPEAPPVYPEIERQYNEQPPELPPLPEGDGQDEQQPQPYQDNGGEQYPNLPEPTLPEPTLPEPGLDRAPLEQDEPGLQKEIDKQLNRDLPALEDKPQAGLPAFDDPAVETASGQCSQAAGKVIILLDAVGIHSGTTYIKANGKVIFDNNGNVTHAVTVKPTGILSSASFRITPNSKVFMFAGATNQTRHGTVTVNAGKSNQTVHDIVICP